MLIFTVTNVAPILHASKEPTQQHVQVAESRLLIFLSTKDGIVTTAEDTYSFVAFQI
jgi:hypothetical protein